MRQFCTTFLLLALIMTAIRPNRAFACSCVYDPDLTEEERFLANLESSKLVFVGKVLSVETRLDVDARTDNDLKRFVLFAIETVYKGEAFAEHTVLTPKDGASCGMNFAPDSTYLVFATNYGEDDPVWNTEQCSGNVQGPSAEMLAVFGAGMAPAPGALILESAVLESPEIVETSPVETLVAQDENVVEETPEAVDVSAETRSPNLWIVFAGLLLLVGLFVYLRRSRTARP